jgi:putative N6-adenine-specific DNA methylase
MTGPADMGALHKRIRRHVTGREQRFFAVARPGFEHLALEELRDNGLSAGPTVLPGGVEFTGKLDACYRANLCCRTVTRVLMRLAEFRVKRFAKLRSLAGDIPWELYLSPGVPVALSAAAHGSRLFHTGRIETEFRRAITARFGPPGTAPDFPDSPSSGECHAVHIRLDEDLCTVSLDSSGEPLYKRGHRLHIEAAPLRETLAAALLMEAGIGRCGVLVDPMAGSGAFSLEAGLIALNIPPGLHRSFAFEKWPSFSAPAHAHLAKVLGAAVRPAGSSSIRIFCSDIDGNAVETARRNVERAGLGDIIAPRQADFLTDDIAIPEGVASLVALNPPYGKRMGSPGQAPELYKKIGERMRARYPRSGLAVIAAGKACEKALGLEFDRKIPFTHGGISVAALIRLPRF